MHKFARSAAYSYKPRLKTQTHSLTHTHISPQVAPPLLQRSFATSTLRLTKSDSSSPKVRWYKQLYDGLVDRQPLDPDNEDADEDPDTSLVREKLKQVEAEIEELSGEKTSTIEPLLEKLSPEDRDKVRAALREAELNGEDGPPTDEENRMVEEEMMKIFPEDDVINLRSTPTELDFGDWEDQLDLLPGEALHIRHFTQSLRKFAKNPSEGAHQKKVWQSYVRCKYNAPPFMNLASDEVWDALWMSQFNSSLELEEQAKRMSALSTDMMDNGKELNMDQKLVFIQSLILEGNQTKAMDYWQSQQSTFRANGQAPLEFDFLGVRLYALQGNPRKAQRIALDVLESSHKGVSHVLIPVIEAWIRSGGELGIKHAWAVYLHLRAQRGSTIQLDDYDTISMGFLNVGRTDLALAVFKDMMLTGESTNYESTELYRKSLGLVGEFQSSSVDPRELTKVSLTALTALPRKFQNKFFYGSWMKRLIGMGEVDAASMVIELMYERGVKPDAKHLNGIMGAWLRSGHPRKKEKAEKLGWAMIHERLDLVNRRSRNVATVSNGSDSTEILDIQDVQIPTHLRRTVSPATIETFSLLLLYYERRGMSKHVQLLRDFLPRAQIQPNAYFMNHLIYAELRRGNHRKSWHIYQTMSPKVRPDLETFASLWDCQKAHQNRLSMYKSDHFPGPRHLLCDMISWYSVLRHKQRTEVREGFSKELYEQIVRCFCLAQDLEGTLVTLYALKESFGFIPDKDTARMITLQVASLGVGELKAPGRRRSRLSGNSQHKQNIARIAQVMELLTEQRRLAVEEKRVVLDEKGKAEEQLWLLAELLRTVLKRKGEEWEEEVSKAAWEMGVSGVRMEDPLANFRQS